MFTPADVKTHYAATLKATRYVVTRSTKPYMNGEAQDALRPSMTAPPLGYYAQQAILRKQQQRGEL